MTSLACQKTLFSLPEDIHYLNCAYMSPLSKAVEAAGIEGIRLKAQPTRIKPADFFSQSQEARRLFGQLVNADPAHIAIIPAVSYGVATVASNLNIVAGQSVVLLHEQFPSNVYAWHNLRHQGVQIRTVASPTQTKRAENWNTRLLESIDETTAVVAIEQVHWTDGTRFDVEAVAARCREVGAALVIDATQSLGALPFDVAQVQPDALIAAGYKTLMGPYGIGFAYLGPRFAEGQPLEETWIARRGSEDFSRLVDYQDDYATGAVRYDMGERSNPVLLSMMIQALRDVLGRGPEHIQAYCQQLSASLFEEATELGFQIEDENWRVGHLFGLRATPTDLEPIKQALEEARVYVSVRGDAIRVSPNIYNNEADFAALKSALSNTKTAAR